MMSKHPKNGKVNSLALYSTSGSKRVVKNAPVLKHKLTPNLIRTSFAVHMLQNGADLKSLQELMGHEDITATHIVYAIDKIIAQDGKTGKHDTVWLNREVMGL